MIEDLCKLCGEQKELSHSHVIGKSVFKQLNKSSGKHYGISTDFENDRIVRTTDQWATSMLCEDCENFLNSRYENYSLWALKNKQKGVKHQLRSDCLSIKNVNQKRLILYVISIFWRAAVSNHKVFKDIIISPEMNEYLRGCILGKYDIDKSLFSVRISKLVDNINFYSEDIIQGVITNLAYRTVSKGKCYIMIFSGYCFEILIDNLSPFERYSDGILRSNKTTLNLPFKDILSIKELVLWLNATKEIADRDRCELTFLDFSQ